MTKEEFAKMLDGRELGNELSNEEVEIAKDSGLVVVYGAAEDHCKFRGAIKDDEYGYDSGDIYFMSDGIVEQCMEFEKCKLFKAASKNMKKITVLWDEDKDFMWMFQTDIPHETFRIYKNRMPYCKGIVFDASELEGSHA